MKEYKEWERMGKNGKEYFNSILFQRISKKIKENQRIMCIKRTFVDPVGP